MQRAFLAAVIALAGISSRADAPPRGASPEVIASQSCQEAFSNRAVANYPKAAMKDRVSGYSVVKFDLDGSGRARNMQIVESVPPGIFDASAVGALERSSFKVGATARDCRYVADFAAVRRSAP
jgi:TonB family protein